MSNTDLITELIALNTLLRDRSRSYKLYESSPWTCNRMCDNDRRETKADVLEDAARRLDRIIANHVKPKQHEYDLPRHVKTLLRWEMSR